MINKKKSNCGRPAGRRKTAKIEISIEPAVKDEFMTLLHSEGKTASVEIGLWIREYIKSSKLKEEE
ncbi:MAG: antitoxin [Lachnospiraceae bacterium]|nr:antitoxin [Lachnospiraceae bacterium]